jgi:hypothetical protein
LTDTPKEFGVCPEVNTNLFEHELSITKFYGIFFEKKRRIIRTEEKKILEEKMVQDFDADCSFAFRHWRLGDV